MWLVELGVSKSQTILTLATNNFISQLILLHCRCHGQAQEGFQADEHKEGMYTTSSYQQILYS
jgi:hypothetical protein